MRESQPALDAVLALLAAEIRRARTEIVRALRAVVEGPVGS